MEIFEQRGSAPVVTCNKVGAGKAGLAKSFTDGFQPPGTGVTASAGFHTVCILFTAEVMHCVMEQRWFEGQRLIRHENGATELWFNVFDLDGLDRWVLSWGVDAIALKPNELRLKVIETLQCVIDKHPEQSLAD